MDSCSQEIIITGAGIGFKKKKGEELDKSRVEKIYCLKSAEDNYRLQQVVREISEKYLEIAGKVVNASREAGLKVRDTLYVTLTDHINSAVERYQAPRPSWISGARHTPSAVWTSSSPAVSSRPTAGCGRTV